MNLKIILINLFLILSVDAFCQFNGTWISKYYTYISREDNLKHDVKSDIIWKIENETIITAQFERHSSYGQPQISVELKLDTIELKIEDNDFILSKGESIDTVNCSLSNEELSIIGLYHDKKVVFEKLPKYHQASQKSQFELFLKNNIFKEPEEDVVVEFFQNHRLISPDLKNYGRHNPYWIVEEFEDEIFLILSGIEESVLHIKEFNEEGFNFIYYYYDPGFKHLKFEKIETIIKYDKENLIGKWEIKPENLEHPPFKSDSDSLKYVYKELIVFKDSTLINNYGFTSKTSRWELNLNNEILLIPQLYDNIRRHQWNIKHLTENKLIVERMKRKVDSDSSYYEMVEFSKIE